MEIKILSLLFALGALVGCSQPKTSISVMCEKDNNGTLTLKWEVFPEYEDANIEIYASDNDSVFLGSPIKVVNLNKFIAVIKNADSLNYNFFKLKVGDTYSKIVSNRFFELDNVQNFRDLGGYTTNDNRTIRWRKIFRSGDFSDLSDSDNVQLERLNIKTVIDLRSNRSQIAKPDKFVADNRYKMSMTGTASDSVAKRVMEDRFLKGDAVLYMQDLYLEMVEKYNAIYIEFFERLLEPKNYPIVFHCSLGKDQTGILSYLLLRALDVPSELAEDDYMYSNMGIDKSKLIKGAFDMSESKQEAFTMLTRTDFSYLRYALSSIKKRDGSVDAYMTNKLGLTKEKREKLREILLY